MKIIVCDGMGMLAGPFEVSPDERRIVVREAVPSARDYELPDEAALLPVVLPVDLFETTYVATGVMDDEFDAQVFMPEYLL